MSRKRPHQDDSQQNLYLLPGSYATCSCSQHHNANHGGDFFKPVLFIEEQPYAGDSLYIVDTSGNIFYSDCLSYLCCEDIVCCADAQVETDNISDPEAERVWKKSRMTIPSSDEEEADYGKKQKICSSSGAEEQFDDDSKEEVIKCNF